MYDKQLLAVTIANELLKLEIIHLKNDDVLYLEK